MKKNVLLLLMLLLASLSAWSQKHDATIRYTDGSSRRGVVKSFWYDAFSVKFKAGEEEKFSKVPLEKISRIVIHSEKGEDVLVEKIRVKGRDDDQLYPVVVQGRVNLYCASFSRGGMYWEHWVFKRPGEKEGMYVNSWKFVAQLTEYFKDAPHIVKGIENNTYKNMTYLVQMAQDYNKMLSKRK
jgi:hypothetical protein